MCLIDTASHRIMVQHKSGPQTVQASAFHVGEEQNDGDCIDEAPQGYDATRLPQVIAVTRTFIDVTNRERVDISDDLL